MGKLCIEVDPTSKIAFISEELCIGCGICVKKCPFEVLELTILNTLPSNRKGAILYQLTFSYTTLYPCTIHLQAVYIINLPSDLSGAVTHRYRYVIFDTNPVTHVTSFAFPQNCDELYHTQKYIRIYMIQSYFLCWSSCE